MSTLAALLAIATASAAPPSLGAIETGLAQRILVVADEPGERLPRRVVDELAALGFDPVMRDDDDVIGAVGVVDAARNLGAVAAVELHGTRVDLWADLWREHPFEPHLYANAAHAAWEADANDVALSAVRIAEVVRARVIGSERAHILRRDKRAQAHDVIAPADVPRALQLVVGAGPSGTWSGDAPARLGSTLCALASIDFVPLDVGVRVTLPLSPSSVEAAAGNAELWPFDGVLSVAYRVEIADDMDIALGVSGGARWLRGHGTAHDGTVVEGDLVSVLVAGDATLRWRLSGPLSLWLQGEMGGALPRPVVEVGEREVSAGPAYASVAGGFSLTFPEDP